MYLPFGISISVEIRALQKWHLALITIYWTLDTDGT